jgi:hypothetical protein
MNRLRRAAVTACILSMGFALAGCESFEFDKITGLLDTKKPLPGERKALFPEGVPGVEQGVPPELQRGRQNAAAEPTGSVEETTTKQAAAAEPEKPAKPKAKPKPRKKLAAAPPQQSTAATPAAAARPAGTPWPSSQQPAAAQAAPAPGAAPWPSAPPTGTFSR